MAEFLTTAATLAAFERLVRDAKVELFLVSPYLKLSPHVLPRLRDAADRGVRVTIVYGKSEMRSEERRKLLDILGLQVRYLERLHAKCYASETAAIVSSLNLHEYSERQNREMSVLLTRTTDAVAYAELLEEVTSITRESTVEHLANRKGFCVECGIATTYDPWRPHCDACFRGWETREVPAHPHCHGCGKASRISRERPLCRECYAEDPFNSAAASF